MPMSGHSHTNETEFNDFWQQKSEALHDRMIHGAHSYNLKVSQEERIYHNCCSRPPSRGAYGAPYAARGGHLCRLVTPEEPKISGLTLLKKLKTLRWGRRRRLPPEGRQADPGATEREGMDGISPPLCHQPDSTH